jgi:Tfp pilus assembly protein FimT
LRDIRGYSVVEIVLVLLVVAVVAAISQPLLSSSLQEAALSAAAGETVTALRFARMSAASQGRPCRVTFDLAADNFVVEQASPDSADLVGLKDDLVSEIAASKVEAIQYAVVQHPLKRGHGYQVNFGKDARFRGVDVTAVDFGPDDGITFDDRGRPSEGGSVRLGLGEVGVLLTVDVVTGRVTRTEVSAIEVVVE